MMPDDRKLLQETRDAAVATATRVESLVKDVDAMKARLTILERWHWGMHAVGASVLGVTLFFSNEVRSIIARLS